MISWCIPLFNPSTNLGLAPYDGPHKGNSVFELIPGTDIWCFVNSNNPQEGLRNYGGSQALLLQKKPTMMADHSEVQTIEHDNPETALAESLALDNVIRRHVQQVLELNHGNKLRTARTLRVSRSTLYPLLNRHNRENATL